jgi:hypothetical protein
MSSQPNLDTQSDVPQSAGLAIPATLLEVFREFRTAEFTTIGRHSVPITWPVLPFYDAETGQFSVATSIGLPQKAFNVRHDGRVSMLFSESTASGLVDPPAILVQGDAVAPDEIITDLAGNRELLLQVFRRQPNSAMYSSNALMRYLFDWYYMRLFIYITPRRILWWDDQDFSRTPHILDFTGTHTDAESSASPRATAQPQIGAQPAGALDWALEELARYERAVLTGFDAHGYPSSIRCQVDIARGGDSQNPTVHIHAPGDHEIESGPANLLAHYHDEHLWNLRSVSVRGQLVQEDNGLVLHPQQASGNRGRLRDLFGFLSSSRRNTKTYLARRNLDRPQVPWDDIIALKKEALGK